MSKSVGSLRGAISLGSTKRSSAACAKLVAVAMGTACLLKMAVALAPNQEHWIRVRIPPECMIWYYGPDFVEADGTKSKLKRPKFVLWNADSPKPLTFKDPRTSISFYVESDGRHLAAIDAAGKLLWVRNPFEDAHLCPYGNPRPSISSISIVKISVQMAEKMRVMGMDPSHEYLDVKFDSRMFGVVDETNGDFHMWGQN
jgi:hypothetical protein